MQMADHVPSCCLFGWRCLAISLLQLHEPEHETAVVGDVAFLPCQGVSIDGRLDWFAGFNCGAIVRGCYVAALNPDAVAAIVVIDAPLFAVGDDTISLMEASGGL
jgi:hypothetical protein